MWLFDQISSHLSGWLDELNVMTLWIAVWACACVIVMERDCNLGLCYHALLKRLMGIHSLLHLVCVFVFLNTHRHYFESVLLMKWATGDLWLHGKWLLTVCVRLTYPKDFKWKLYRSGIHTSFKKLDPVHYQWQKLCACSYFYTFWYDTLLFSLSLSLGWVWLWFWV